MNIKDEGNRVYFGSNYFRYRYGERTGKRFIDSQDSLPRHFYRRISASRTCMVCLPFKIIYSKVHVYTMQSYVQALVFEYTYVQCRPKTIFQVTFIFVERRFVSLFIRRCQVKTAKNDIKKIKIRQSRRQVPIKRNFV